MQDNGTDHRQLREAKKRARAAEAAAAGVMFRLMADPESRAYVHDLLLRGHVFTSSFSDDPYRTAFAEGERNFGLQLLADVMRWTPDQYIQMMREANDRSTSDDRHKRNRPNGGRDVSGTGTGDSAPDSPADYDPIAELSTGEPEPA